MLMSSGFTDDLFPADETIRYYNRTKTAVPATPIWRCSSATSATRAAQNKADVTGALQRRDGRLVRLLRQGRRAPRRGRASRPTPRPARARPPRAAPTAPTTGRESRPARSASASDATKTIAAGLDHRRRVQPGHERRRLRHASPDRTRRARRSTGSIPAPAGGYTLLGAPTVIADFTLPGDTSQVAARLVDVAPDDTETLVARGLWRPATGGPTRQVFQLHPERLDVRRGHVPKLELLAADADGRRLPTTAGRPTTSSPSPSRACGCGCRSSSARAPAADSSARRLPSSSPRARGWPLTSRRWKAASGGGTGSASAGASAAAPCRTRPIRALTPTSTPCPTGSRRSAARSASWSTRPTPRWPRRSSAPSSRTSCWRATSARCWPRRTTSTSSSTTAAIVPDPEGHHHRRPRQQDRAHRRVPRGETINARALCACSRQIIANNRAGGWRELKRGA